MDNKNKLSHFYQLTLEDPLFAAEGLDLENALSAVQELEEVTTNLEIIKNGFSRYLYFLSNPLKNTLHPLRFLKQFIESERERRLFLACPCFDHGRKLLQSHYKTLSALDKDLAAYRKACMDAQKKTVSRIPGAKAYNFYQSRVSFQDFANCINLMQKNASVLRGEVNKRNTLFLNSVKNNLLKKTEAKEKVALLKADPIPGQKSNKKLPKKTMDFVNMANEGRDYIYYLEKRFGSISTELYGPIIYKLAQFDPKPKQHSFFLSVVRDKNNTKRGLFAILSDEFHFLDLAKDKYKFYADIFIYEPLIKRGIPYWYQPATSFYFSSDLTYYADLATIYDLNERPNLNKQLVLQQKSSLLDLLLWNGYFHNLGYYKNIKARIKAGKKINTWHYLLVGRSYASLYYMPFNKSVWRISIKPNFFGNSSKQAGIYIKQDKLPKSLGKKTLENIFNGGKIRAEDEDEIINTK